MAACGVNAYIMPSSWYSHIIVTIQMMVSVIYTVVIFGMGLNNMEEILHSNRKQTTSTVIDFKMDLEQTVTPEDFPSIRRLHVPSERYPDRSLSEKDSRGQEVVDNISLQAFVS